MQLLLPALAIASVVLLARIAAKTKRTAAPSTNVYSPELWVGDGWTNWPQKDKYPTEGAVAGILFQLGYNPGGAFSQPGYKITSQEGQDAVSEFQADANTIHEFLVHQGKVPQFKFLTITGFIDPPTLEAMFLALGANWQQLRDEAYGS